MSKGSTALLVVGVLVILLAVVSIAFDLLGRGDTQGLDPKDLGLLAVGVVLAGIGAALGARPRPV